MATEWIEKLADGIKQKNHEAAEEFGRAQHYAGIVAEVGKEYFVALTFSLQENVEAMRRMLQGDVTSADTTVQTVKVGEVKIARARFPWVDGRLVHNGDTLVLDYARGPGVEGDPNQDRKVCHFTFKVAPDDSLFVEDAFAPSPRQYKQPDELARHITEALFAA
jgi:hypothetical protein